ncbi:MAG: hypothetical protein AAGA48_19985 [Myxococcota bacterium]
MTPEEAQEAELAMDKVARFLVRFELTVPAILWLESLRPLARTGSQFMHLLTPAIGAFLPVNQWNALATLLEEPDGLERFVEHLENVDREARGSAEEPR